MKNQLFRTPVTIPKQKPVNPDKSWFSIGSCFAEEIALKLSQSGLKIYSNPSGILFNPISISNALTRIFQQNLYEVGELQKVDDYFFEWGHHGLFRNHSSKELLDRINKNVVQGGSALRTCDNLIITWGSAIVYKLKENGRVVGNCHKQPNTLFDRTLLEVDEIVDAYIKLFETLININPSAKIILTVSPVRYLKDGFVENQLSKSILFVALNKLIEMFPDHISYFPSYEIMMDELRDYRFYKSDMIHPNDQAIELIWEYFKQTYYSEKDQKFFEEVDAYNRMKDHRPLFPDSAETDAFKILIRERCELLIHKYPFIILGN